MFGYFIITKKDKKDRSPSKGIYKCKYKKEKV